MFEEEKKMKAKAARKEEKHLRRLKLEEEKASLLS